MKRTKKKGKSGKKNNKTTDFSIIKWNARVNFNKEKPNDFYQKRGMLILGHEGSYWCDKKFTCNKKGFVVQLIEKKIIELNNHILPEEETKNIKYWEIFYIGDDGMSYNTDGFVQRSCGFNSSGKIEQKGTSYFYEYNKPVNFDDNGSMIITNNLEKIFGKHVNISDSSNANGLPYSLKKPLMNGLKKTGKVLEHVVVVSWKARKKSQVIEKVKKGNEMVSLNRPKNYLKKSIEAWSTLSFFMKLFGF